MSIIGILKSKIYEYFYSSIFATGKLENGNTSFSDSAHMKFEIYTQSI